MGRAHYRTASFPASVLPQPLACRLVAVKVVLGLANKGEAVVWGAGRVYPKIVVQLRYWMRAV